MAHDRVRLEVKERESCGSREARRLRRAGFVPGVLYGGGGAPHPFYIGERELRHALSGEHGRHALLDIVLEGRQKAHHAVLKDYQLDPLRSTLVHVDLHEVRLDRPIQTQVAVELVGTPEGVARGGLLSQILREVTVEALPTAVPDRLELDVTGLGIGESIQVSEIAAPEGVRILDDLDAVIASVVVPRRVVAEEEEVPEEEEAAEAAPEAAAEAEAGAPAEAEAGE
jgi:large subunit ribosomal protein L25